MCLYTKQKKQLIAAKDIVCYKVLEYRKLFNEWGLYSPYARTKFEEGGLYSDIYKVVKSYCYSSGEDMIDKGCFHSIATLKEAKIMLKYIRNVVHPYTTPDYYLRIYKCIIPKGSAYYIGNYEIEPFINKRAKSYASKKIKIIKKVFEKNYSLIEVA